ncbi:hypothetical protein [Salegentibacter mishustinae]|uniref:hypothetical protein n=1 Tax=Salegentibacter mishustinae TaxID=270918 RepID=UPI002490BBDF|nr:hypothetical protein [Salegentibacter mishustinae]
MLILITISSCVSKNFKQLERKHLDLKDQLNTATVKLNYCFEEKDRLNNQISVLDNTNAALLNNVGDLWTLSKKEAEYNNLETDYLQLNKEYEQIKSKINNLNDIYSVEWNSDTIAVKKSELLRKEKEINNLSKQKIRNELVRAELTYYCPREIMEGEEFSLAVLISKVLERRKLEDTLVKSLRYSDIVLSEEEITEYITSHSIKIGDSIRVTINFDKEEFKLLVSEPRDTRKIGNELEEWVWRIKALGPGDHKITVVIETFASDDWRKAAPLKSFPINVRIDHRNYWYKLWELIKEDPEWPIVTLFIPVFTFFAGIWKERRKEKET